MILLEALVERLRAVPFNFSLSAAHIEATGIGYEINRNRLTLFCEHLGVPLHYRTIEPDLEKDPSKTACRSKIKFLHLLNGKIRFNTTDTAVILNPGKSGDNLHRDLHFNGILNKGIHSNSSC